jgi:iron complex outermembrane receptor protein
VRYITNQPRLGETDTVVDLQTGVIDDGEVGGHAKVAYNTPMGDSAALRITAYYDALPGFIDAVQPDLSTDDDVNGGNRSGARVAFRFEPSENVTVTPRLIYQEVERDGWNRIDVYNILANPFTTTRPALDLGEREQFTQLEEEFTDEFLLVDLNVEVGIGDDLTLTSITSYTDRDVLVIRDAGALTSSITGGSIGLPEPVFTLDSPLLDDTTAQVLTQELRLAGSRERLDWLVGAFYSTTDRDYGQALPVNGFETLTGIPTAGTFGAARDVLFYSDLSYELEQIALFGEATYAVTDRFELTGGLRVYDFQEDRVQTFDGIFAAPGTTVGSVEADGVAPRILASFALTEDTTLNAQVSKGFRLGGINDPLNLPLCTPEDEATFGGQDTWEDEELWNYEVGSKSRLMDGRATFNVAAFYMDISDLQATVTAGTCSSRVVFNVPEARSLGAELELAVQPTPWFDFAISASYTDSELRSTLTSTNEDGEVTVVSGIEEGNRLPTVPEFQMAAAANYRWEIKDTWAGYLTGVYQHVGSRYTQIGDQAAGFGTVDLLTFEKPPTNGATIGGPLTQDTFTFDPELPAYDIVNLRLGLLTEAMDLSLFVNNVTDERAFLARDQERGTLARVGYLTNRPRTYGLNARFEF